MKQWQINPKSGPRQSSYCEPLYYHLKDSIIIQIHKTFAKKIILDLIANHFANNKKA